MSVIVHTQEKKTRNMQNETIIKIKMSATGATHAYGARESLEERNRSRKNLVFLIRHQIPSGSRRTAFVPRGVSGVDERSLSLALYVRRRQKMRERESRIVDSARFDRKSR